MNTTFENSIVISFFRTPPSAPTACGCICLGSCCPESGAFWQGKQVRAVSLLRFWFLMFVLGRPSQWVAPLSVFLFSGFSNLCFYIFNKRLQRRAGSKQNEDQSVVVNYNSFVESLQIASSEN